MSFVLDPVLALALVLGAALLGGAAAVRLGQRAVVGELIAGIVLGNLPLVGVHALSGLARDPFLDAVARLGVILLLFEVGLQSTVAEMRRIGVRSLAVALLGVLASVALGWTVAALLLPGKPALVHALVGGAIASSSVGVSARVLKELRVTATAEARLILGSAVVDDVLGLVLLAVLAGLLRAEGAAGATSMIVLGKAAAFLAVALTLGVPITRRLFTMVAHLRHPGIVVGSALVFCLAVSFLAEWVGLAAIVGAFVAGLVLEEAHLRPFGEARPLGELIEPLTAFLGPVFFAVMGTRTNLGALGSSHALSMGALLVVAAIAGKAACAIAVGGGVDRVAVVLGLLPRGEVTLVFANLGLGLGVFDQGVFAALMLVVLVTVLLTPPALSWRLRATQPAEATRPSPS